MRVAEIRKIKDIKDDNLETLMREAEVYLESKGFKFDMIKKPTPSYIIKRLLLQCLAMDKEPDGSG